MRRSQARALPALLPLLAAACAAPPPDLEVNRDTVGGTVMVRTLSGSAWGTLATRA